MSTSVDSYYYEKSLQNQGVDLETPYISKQWQFANDLNNSSYNFGGLTQVSFNANLYDANRLVNPTEMFVVVPVVLTSLYVSSNTSGTAIAATASTYWATHAMKCGGYQILNSAELTLNGKTIESPQNFTNIYTHAKLLSTLSMTELKNLGQTIGLGDTLPNPQSYRFNAYPNQTTGTAAAYTIATATTLTASTAGLQGGQWSVNNLPFPLSTASQNSGDMGVAGVQNITTYNQGLYSRLKRIYDVSTASASTATNLYSPTTGTGSAAACFMNETQLATEFKAITKILSTNYIVSYDYVILRMCDLFDSMKSLPMVKSLNIGLKLNINTGCVASAIGVSSSVCNMVHSGNTNSFLNTCPIIQCCKADAISTATGLVSALSIARSPTTTFFGANLSLSGASHPLPNCRLYYPSIELKASIMNDYLLANKTKKVVYTSFLFNNASNITAGGTYAGIINAGSVGVKGLWVVPFISASINGTMNTAAITSGTTTYSIPQSPHVDIETGPISLTQLNVQLGNKTVFSAPMNYTFETYLEQLATYERINSLEITGISNGLIDQYRFENQMRFYYINCERGSKSDLLTPKQLSISFLNNTNLTIDVMFFTEVYKTMEYEVETGLVNTEIYN